MTSRTAHVWYVTREEAHCIEFDAELDAYMEGGHAVALLRAAYDVAGSAIKMDPHRAFTIARLTGACDEPLVDYDDAARAIRRWFAQTLEPGARH